MPSMKTINTSRSLLSALLSVSLLLTSGISLAAQPLLSVETKDVIGDEWVDLITRGARVIATERRLCKYEQHECQLVSGL
jgi:hypothetical protein